MEGEKLQSIKDITVQCIDFCEATTSKVHAVLQHASSDLRGGTGSVLIPRRGVSPWVQRTTFIDQIFSDIAVYFFGVLIFIFVFGFWWSMQRVSPQLLTRTSTSFGCWIFGKSADVKYRIL